MELIDYYLASALPDFSDFKALIKQDAFNLKYLQNPKPIRGISQGFLNRLQKLNLVDLEKEYVKAKKFGLLRIDQKSYPEILRKITEPPVYLFVWGKTKAFNKPSLAFVGSRRATVYGKKSTFNLIFNLQFPWAIISGLAMGIDSFSHQAALQSDKLTIAVLGSGFFNLYPSINQKLAQTIVKNGGMVISEYPPHFGPQQYYFPARNRIIAGLSQAVVVVEGAKHSGSLITAGLAGRYGRDVLVVPNDIFSLTSEGCFSLIKQGAKPVFSAEDIEEDYFKLFPKVKISKKTEPILDFLSTPKHIDEVAKFLSMTSGDTLSYLSKLEVENKIKNLGSGFYQTI
jgi:DNA processing protein